MAHNFPSLEHLFRQSIAIVCRSGISWSLILQQHCRERKDRSRLAAITLAIVRSKSCNERVDQIEILGVVSVNRSEDIRTIYITALHSCPTDTSELACSAGSLAVGLAGDALHASAAYQFFRERENKKHDSKPHDVFPNLNRRKQLVSKEERSLKNRKRHSQELSLRILGSFNILIFKLVACEDDTMQQSE